MKRRWLCGLLAVCITILIAACQPNGSNQPPESRPAGQIVAEQDELSLSAELVNGAVKGNLLRLDCVSPGLDTFNLTVKLYSLSDKKVLCSVSLGEDAWETGWLSDGFYAISLTKQTAYLYQNNGTLVRSLPLPSGLESIQLAALDEAATTFLLGDGKTAKLYLSPITGSPPSPVAPINGYMCLLGYRDGAFYATNSTTGELLEIPINATIATVPYCAPHTVLNTHDYGIAVTETNFSVYTSGKEKPSYVPFHRVDEIPIAADKNGFLTIANETDKCSLYRYDLRDNALTEYAAPPGSYQVFPLDGGDLLVLYKQDANTHLCRIAADSFADRQTLAVSDTDSIPLSSAPSTPAQTGSSNSTSKRISVPPLSQWPEYPTGCESVTAVMALRYAGETITVADFIDNYLPKSAKYYFKDGVRYGPDPYKVFIGSPRTAASYGCMAPVIEAAVNNYFGKEGRVINTTGLSIDELCSVYIDNNIPVMIWATIAMLDSSPGATWYLEDGSRFSWPQNEHCLLLVGYDENQYYFNDPYTGSVTSYDKKLSRTRYEILGKQSLVVK